MKKKRGRPLIQLDWDVFERLCGIQCTLEEIADFFRCSSDTIERSVKRHYGQDFAEIFRQKRGNGKISLRRKIYELAVKGDRTLLIWASKQYLGMSDKVEQKQEISAKVESLAIVSDEELSERIKLLQQNK